MNAPASSPDAEAKLRAPLMAGKRARAPQRHRAFARIRSPPARADGGACPAVMRRGQVRSRGRSIDCSPLRRGARARHEPPLRSFGHRCRPGIRGSRSTTLHRRLAGAGRGALDLARGRDQGRGVPFLLRRPRVRLRLPRVMREPTTGAPPHNPSRPPIRLDTPAVRTITIAKMMSAQPQKIEALDWSGRQDLNLRPPGPELPPGSCPLVRPLFSAAQALEIWNRDKHARILNPRRATPCEAGFVAPMSPATPRNPLSRRLNCFPSRTLQRDLGVA